jgi:FMNH2-dependent dimethyl sulfone monooxygenase
MFGMPLVEKGYDQAAEWLDILERLYASDEPFDHEGTYYQLQEAVSRPASLQRPRPITMNAAFGGPGRDFAAARCDYLFTTFSELRDADKHVADIGARAAQNGRKLGCCTVAHVVCRPTDTEADAYYERYAVTMADHEAVDAHMAGKLQFSQSHDRHAYDLYRQRFAGGAGTYPLVGSPIKIAEEMIAIAGQGYEGIALSFVNYTQELPYFCDTVLPILKEAGYRV